MADVSGIIETNLHAYYGGVALAVVDGVTCITLGNHTYVSALMLTPAEAELANQLFQSIRDREPERLTPEQAEHFTYG
jgi:hypothetical protein